MAGQPTKLTKEIQDRLCEAIRDGNYYQAACAYAPVEYRTFMVWMKKGRESGRAPYRQFFQAVTRAKAECEAAIVKDWKAATPADWRAARDFLARRFPRRWGPKEATDVTLDRAFSEGLSAFVKACQEGRVRHPPGGECTDPGGDPEPPPGEAEAGPRPPDERRGPDPRPLAGGDSPLFG